MRVSDLSDPFRGPRDTGVTIDNSDNMVVPGTITPGSFTTGSVLHVGASGEIVEDNGVFYFDTSTNFLAVGENTPTGELSLGDGDSDGAVEIWLSDILAIDEDTGTLRFGDIAGTSSADVHLMVNGSRTVRLLAADAGIILNHDQAAGNDVSFYSSSSTEAFVFDAGTGQLGIGTNAPITDVELQATQSGNADATAINIQHYHDSYSGIGVGASACLRMDSIRGTPASPLAVNSDTVAGVWEIYAYDGTSMVKTAHIGVAVRGTVSTGVVPARWGFATTDLSGNFRNVAHISPQGAFLTDDTGLYKPDVSDYLYVGLNGSAGALGVADELEVQEGLYVVDPAGTADDRAAKLDVESGQLVIKSTNDDETDNLDELLTVDLSARNVIVGSTTPHDANSDVTVYNSTVSSVAIVTENDTFHSGLRLVSSDASQGAKDDGDSLGSILFHASDGTDNLSVAAAIIAAIDGTPGANDTPGEVIIQTTPDGSSTPTSRFWVKENGEIGIRTETPGALLDVRSSGTSAAGGIRLSDSATGAQIGLLYEIGTSDGGLRLWENASTENVRLSTNGDSWILDDFGAGINNPVYRVHIRDTDSVVLRLHRDTNSAANAVIQEFALDNSAGAEHQYARIYAAIADNTSASEDGIFAINHMAAGAWQEAMRTSASGVIINEGSADLNTRVESNGNANMIFVDAGNDVVGIGTGSPSGTYALDVNGQVHASSFPTSSDRRFKRNKTPLHTEFGGSVLDELRAVRPVAFNWNQKFLDLDRLDKATSSSHFIRREDRPRRGETAEGWEDVPPSDVDRYTTLQTRQIGFVAQDVEEVFPQVISLWDGKDGVKDYRALDYSRLTAILWQAVLEQDERITTLEARLQAQDRGGN